MENQQEQTPNEDYQNNGMMTNHEQQQHEVYTPEPEQSIREEETAENHLLQTEGQSIAGNTDLLVADYPGLLPNMVRWKPGAVVIKQGLPLDLPYWMMVVEINDPRQIIIGQLPCAWLVTWYPREGANGQKIDPFGITMLPIESLYHPSTFGCKLVADQFDEYIMSQQKT